VLARVWGTDPATLRERVTREEFEAMVELLAAEAERMAGDPETTPATCACGSPAVPAIEHGPASCRPAAVA
jgi:hypothetical protein